MASLTGSDTSGQRPPLRERCGVTFTVKTTDFHNHSRAELRSRSRGRTSGSAPDRRYLNVPTRIRPSPTASGMEVEPSVSDGIARIMAVQEIVPGLIIASHNNLEQYCVRGILERGRNPLNGFTHIVCVSEELVGNSGVATESAVGNGTRVLHLPVPFGTHATSHTALSRGQLRVARDFLALAMPTLSPRTRRPLAEQARYPPVRVLVAAPGGHAADALAIVVCYLAHSEKMNAGDIVRTIDEERVVLPEWREVLSDRCLGYMESVVRMP